MEIWIQCFIAGIIGIIVQIYAKLTALKKRSEAANAPWKLMDFFKKDWLTILGSLLAVGVAIYLSDEIITKYPAIQNYLKGTFAFIGYSGSSLLLLIFSKKEKEILDVVDKKTNKADGIE